MANSQDANFSCERIHNFIHSSGLHYIINQTPWSSYITIRKKLRAPAIAVEPSVDELSEEMRIIRERNKYLENKLEIVQQELLNAEEKNVKEKHDSEIKVDNLQAKIDKLENAIKDKEAEIEGLEKEKKKKDEIINNINAGLNKQVKDLSDKLDEVEAKNRKTLKDEKKAIKKQRQAAKKLDGDIIFESKSAEHNIEKDKNENLLHYGQDCEKNLSIFPDIPLPVTSAILHPGVAIKQNQAGRPPCTPPSPHTPPGPPPAPAPLTYYFGDSSIDMFKNTSKPKTAVTVDYIKSISKINLLPKSEERK